MLYMDILRHARCMSSWFSVGETEASIGAWQGIAAFMPTFDLTLEHGGV